MNNEEYLISILSKASDCYYNLGEYLELSEEECDSIKEILQIPCQLCVSDPMFDEIYKKTKMLYPDNEFFKKVGIEERSLKKVKLPFIMGSMTELHKGELLNWINKDWQYCCSAKLDGCSCGLLYKNGKLFKAYTRGDGYEGQDITSTVMRFGNHLPKTIPLNEFDVFIRGEIIIPKKDIPNLLNELKEETGREYKNGRNSVAGCLNAKTAPKTFVKYAHLLCYHIEGDFVRESHIFESLENCGFETPYWGLMNGDTFDEEDMIENNVKMRDEYEYEVDGTIITENLRINKGFDNGTINPKMSKKFKIGCVNDYKESKVINIHWQISKDGYAKPVVEIEPIELDGASVSFVTGNNFDNIINNKISIGSTVKCHRAGQVIPFIDEVVESNEEENYNIPNMAYFDHIGTDLVLSKHPNYENFSDEMINEYMNLENEMLLQKTVYFCQKVGIDFAGEGNLRKLLGNITESYTSNPGVYKLLMYTRDYMIEVLGINGGKLYDSAIEKLTNVSEALFFDAIGAFGRGIGSKKLQKLLDKYGTLKLTYEQVVSTEGFADTSAKQYTDNIQSYEEWYNIIHCDSFKRLFSNTLPFKSNTVEKISNKFKDLVVVFTGIRDKQMEDVIVKNGGKVISSFTKDTNLLIVKDINSNSSKVTKARERNVQIISYEDAKGQFK